MKKLLDEKNQALLSKIIGDDSFNLLSDNTKQPLSNEDQHLVDSFYEIVSFYERTGNEPTANGDIQEFKLYTRLKSIRNNPDLITKLSQYDFYNLLTIDIQSPITLNDVLKDENGLLDDDVDDSIYKLKYVTPTERLSPDHISYRTKCKNFDKYEPMFSKIHTELENGTRRLIDFDQKDIAVGKYYVLSGIITYLESFETSEMEHDFGSGTRTRSDGGTHCIFDNGTESTMLLRSLVKGLQKDGHTISDIKEKPTICSDVNIDDKKTGIIYVVRSLSNNPEISKINDLYKIGYCTNSIEERFKNAENEPTYLLAKVEPLVIKECYNLDIRKFEDAIHDFFRKSNANITVVDSKGIVHYPEEWFIAPKNVILDAIDLIAVGQSSNYYYSPVLKKIVQKASDQQINSN